MDKRRTAADALQMSPDVASFISSGVPATTSDDESNRLDKRSNDGQKKEPNSSASQKDSNRSKPKRIGRTKQKSRSKAETQAKPTPAYTQAMAQARIQKSVRFLPQLIAQFEDHCQQEFQAGRKPPSLQDALNEALRHWLAEPRASLR